MERTNNVDDLWNEIENSVKSVVTEDYDLKNEERKRYIVSRTMIDWSYY